MHKLIDQCRKADTVIKLTNIFMQRSKFDPPSVTVSFKIEYFRQHFTEVILDFMRYLKFVAFVHNPQPEQQLYSLIKERNPQFLLEHFKSYLDTNSNRQVFEKKVEEGLKKYDERKQRYSYKQLRKEMEFRQRQQRQHKEDKRKKLLEQIMTRKRL